MSTNLRDRTSPPTPDEGPDEHDKPKASLNITQVIGGALAAMTAAALGSRLSVAGTVVGAAFASVVAAVGGSIYTASLRRTGEHVSTVLSKVRPTSGGASAPGVDAPATTPSADAADTATHTATDWALPDEPASQTLGTTVPDEPASQTPGTTVTDGRRAPIGWKRVLTAALLMFGLAAVALTGIELVTGHALSGGTGTTVGQVAEGGTKPSARPTGAATASPSASRSATQSAGPTASTSSTASSGPTAAPTASDSAAPSSTPTPTSSGTPPTSASPGATPGS